MAHTLSYAERLQLIKVVIMGMQAYWAQIFVLPQKVIKHIEAIWRSYLWSSTSTITKKAIVPWGKICLPRRQVGKI